MLRLAVEPGAGWRMPFSPHELRSLFEVMLHATGLADYDVELTITDDATIAEVNAAQLGCTGPTNILSFPQFSEDLEDPAPFAENGGNHSDTAARPLLGVLLLSVDTLHREALLYGQSVPEHCLRLIAHGLGHVAGYDHGPEMQELEDAALNAALEAAPDITCAEDPAGR